MDAVEIDSLYRRYGPMVLRRCRHMLGEEEAALDALQDVFAKLMDQVDLSVEFPSSYLYTAATRICLDRLRSAPVRNRGEDTLLDEIACSEDLEEQMGFKRILDGLFRRHEESTKVIAVLHFVDGLTLEETAEQVGLSVSGVRKRLETLKSRAAAWADRNSRGAALPTAASMEGL